MRAARSRDEQEAVFVPDAIQMAGVAPCGQVLVGVWIEDAHPGYRRRVQLATVSQRVVVTLGTPKPHVVTPNESACPEIVLEDRVTARRRYVECIAGQVCLVTDAQVLILDGPYETKILRIHEDLVAGS